MTDTNRNGAPVDNAWAAVAARLREIHRPESVEVEIYHRDDDDLSSRPGPCPEPNPAYPSDPCPGHMEEILYCVECGMGDSGFGDLAYLEWPCRTIEALDTLGWDDHSGSEVPR